MKSVHSGRLERWLGAERVENLSKLMKGWYGAPIHILDCPGTVLVCGDGDFIGNFERGYFMSAMDSLWHLWKRTIKYNENVFYAGFASISDALSRASKGYGYSVNIYKTGATGVAGVTNSLWRVGGTPAAGGAPAGAPNGTVFTSSSTGAISYPNPSSGTMHLVGADISASVANNALLLYDLLFGCNKTMNSTDPETVTGVPTRYQSTTATDPDYAGSNFLFVQVGTTALASTAHNWTVCTYKNQSGNSSTLPSLTGNSGAIVHRLDHPAYQWFAPLATGDVGIKALTQMQCSAAVATGEIHFMIGHPIGWMSIPLAYTLIPFDWLTSRNQAPRIFDNACLTFLEVIKPSTSATTYTGVIHMTSAAA